MATAIGQNLPTDPTAAVDYVARLNQFMNQLASDMAVSASQYDTILQSYYAQLGTSLSLDTIDNLHILAATYDGTPGDVVFNFDTAGAVAIGQTGANNILNAGGDISQAIIRHVQTLDMRGAVTLTADQLDRFSTLEGNGQLNTASAGTYSLVGKTNSSVGIQSYASGDTTLIGNDAANERFDDDNVGNDILIAGNGNNDTLYVNLGSGNNTLTAGNGSGDVLIAGSGNDVLTAGDGDNDRLHAGAGTDILTVGNGNNDILYAGSGRVTMNGGNGSDIFMCRSRRRFRIQRWNRKQCI
jgi:Ca2+-binding RTX toxin-like protein